MTACQGKEDKKLWPRGYYIFLVGFWCICSLSSSVRAACPKLCHCKWRDGKETVACPNADFIDIPRGLDPTTQVLDLRRNNLKILPSDAFLDTGLVNLQKVWLNYCKLKYIIDGAFRHLANLIELDLSDNFLTHIPSSQLGDISGLRVLSLSRNIFTKVPKFAFQSVSLLVKLDLSKNNISNVDPQAFEDLSKLEDLKLSSNKLMTLPINVLDPLLSLKGLHVENNPWHCDCRIRQLRQWLLEKNVAASIPPKCESPERLTGRGWQTLDEDEFVCVPQVTAVVQRVIASQGDNVTLACKVEIDADAAVTWFVGGKTLLNTSADDLRKYSVLDLGTNDDGDRVTNLTIEGAAVQDQGTYRCVVENKAGRVETNLTLNVADEVTEIELVVQESKQFPEWIYGTLAGGVVATFMLICIASFKFRRRRVNSKRSAAEDLELGAKESTDTDSSTDSIAHTIQFIEGDKSAQNVSHLTLACSGRQDTCAATLAEECKQRAFQSALHSSSQLPLVSYPGSVLQMPSFVGSQGQHYNISYLHAMLGNQFKEIGFSQFHFDQTTKYPDLLHLPCQTSETPSFGDNIGGSGAVELRSISAENTCSNIVKTRAIQCTSAACTSATCTSAHGINSQPHSNKRHVRFQDEESVTTGEECGSADNKAGLSQQQLLQYHAAQLYKFLQEYQQLQEQLKSFRSNTMGGTSCTEGNEVRISSLESASTSVPHIQSSIEYLLAHQAVIPPPIVDTINQISASNEQQDDISMAYFPPPPAKYASEFEIGSSDPSGSYTSVSGSQRLNDAPAAGLPALITTSCSSEPRRSPANDELNYQCKQCTLGSISLKEQSNVASSVSRQH